MKLFTKLHASKTPKQPPLFIESSDILKIISESLEIPIDTIRSFSRFKEDLGADDLDLYEIIYKIESSHNLIFRRYCNLTAISKFVLVQDIYDDLYQLGVKVI